jgi:hypothetical protein
MDRNAYRDQEGTDQPDTYRRRRAVALVAGLGLIGLLAWAFAGGGGKPGTPPQGSSQTYRLLPVAASRSAAASSPAGARARPRGAASAGASGLPTPAVTPAASGSAAAGRLTPEAGQLTPEAGQQPGGPCAPDTVVLSVFSTRPRYSGGQDPQFSVYAVSTAVGTCTFDLGPGTLHVDVMSSGRIIWDSSDCARSGDTWVARLSRGVPALESITWNRTITLPGCVTLASSARAGTYQAQAWTTSAASAVLSFALVR